MARQRGSHLILIKKDRVVPVPKYDEIKRRLLSEIITEASLPREEFLKLLE